MCLASVGNTSASKAVAIAGSRPVLVTEVISVGRVHIGDKFKQRGGSGNPWYRGIRDDKDMGADWKKLVGRWSPVDNTPIDGVAEIDSQMFQSLVVQLAGGNGELGKESNGVANVKATDDVGEEEFAKKAAIAKARDFFKSGVLWGTFVWSRLVVV